MSDESYIDVNSVLDRPEKWARKSLRDDGYSDAFIDEWIQVDDGLELEDALELITSECEYKLLLIRHIQYLREQLSNGDQSPIDWIWDGFLIAWFHHAGSLSESEKIWFSELQRDRAKRPRNRTNVAERAVEYILRKAPERENDMARFRHHVGDWCRLYGKNIDIDVTAIEDEDDDTKVTSYNIFDNETDERNIVKEATIRGIIRRLNKQSTEKGA